jgi:hypothetical protein
VRLVKDAQTFVWDGEAPVDPHWLGTKVGEQIVVRYVMDLDDIINADGLQGMNEYLDNVVQWPFVMTDIGYAVGQPDPEDQLGNDFVLIEATGILEDCSE